MSTLVAYIVEHIALTLSYPSTQALLSDHLPFLLGRWCEAKLPLQHFPVYLLNETSLEDFLSHFSAGTTVEERGLSKFNLLPRISV